MLAVADDPAFDHHPGLRHRPVRRGVSHSSSEFGKAVHESIQTAAARRLVRALVADSRSRSF